MGEYYSTEETVTARASALRLQGWIDYDGDGIINPDTFLAGQKFARGEIRDRLRDRLGDSETGPLATWDDSTVPESIGAISDDLCIWFFTTTNPKLAPATRILYEDAIAKLEAIANGTRSIYGVTFPTSTKYDTEMMPSDFDPERDLDDMSVRVTWDAPDARELEGC